MGWRTMLRTLQRHRMIPLLVVAQVAFALVVLVNVGSLLYRQMAPVLAPAGVPAGQVLITRQVRASDADLAKWSHARIQAAEQAVRAMPGVHAVSAGLGAPFAADDLALFMQPTTVREHRSASANAFAGDDLVHALGLRVLRGRGFAADDYMRGGSQKIFSAQTVLVTRSLAHQLFPHGKAVGHALWPFSGMHGDRAPIRIIGVVSDTLRTRVAGSAPGQTYNVVLLPYQLDGLGSVAFTVRVDPAQRDLVQKRLPEVLGAALGITRTDAITVRSYEHVREKALHGNRVAAWMLAVVLGTVTLVVVLGITGLSGFWVQKRTREIGIRRALGARRRDILRHYHVENALVVVVGAAVGVALGLAVSAWLTLHFEMTEPPAWTWAAGAAVLVGLGQLAVLGPALRAAAVPPVVATRAV